MEEYTLTASQCGLVGYENTSIRCQCVLVTDEATSYVNGSPSVRV